MKQYFRYVIQLTDHAKRVRVTLHEPNNKSPSQPSGDCDLMAKLPQIQTLAEQVRGKNSRPKDLDALGELLFNALVPPDIASHLRDTLAEANNSEALLRIELDLDESELPAIAALPWELLRAPQTTGRADDNLGTHPGVVLSRRRALWDAVPPIELKEPMRIQLVVAAPSDLGEVISDEVKAEIDKLAQSYPDLIAPPLPVLHQPTLVTIGRALEEHAPHILHFIGHGQLKKVRSTEYGEIALVDDIGRADWRPDEEVGELFQARNKTIVVLQACESGASGSGQAFVGVASQIVQRNVPVVVAMQYPVSNLVAVAFVEEFYRRLGQLEAVDVAVQQARRTLRQKFRNTRDFAAPVLFLRVEDGLLFRQPQPPEPQQPKGVPAKKTPPASDTPLEQFSEEQISSLPHPIAAAAAAYNQEKEDRDRFEVLDTLTINLVKYLTAIALSQYWQDNPDHEKLKQWLGTLSQARLLTSLSILNLIHDEYAQANEKPRLYTVLFEVYHSPVHDESPIASLYRLLRRLQPTLRRRDEDISISTMLTRLIEFRQTRWESNARDIDPKLCTQLLPALCSALRTVLASFQTLFGYPLHYVERIDPTGDGVMVTLVAFPGPEGKPQPAEPFRTSAGAASAIRANNLYLCSPRGEPLLNLHPFLISHLYRLFFLEHASEREEIWYRHCASAERYNPPAYYRLLSISWAKEEQEPDAQPNPVTRLIQANKELEREEQDKGIGEMPLEVLLTHFAPEGQQALELGLGESLRIGQFWLGLEFLLMGMSKQEQGLLPQIMGEMRIDPSDLRGLLRGTVDVSANDWRSKDAHKIGQAAFADLEQADYPLLAANHRAGRRSRPIVTPRLLAVLRAAIRLAEKGKAGHRELLQAMLSHTDCLAVLLLHMMASRVGWTIQRLNARVRQPPENRVEHAPDREAVPFARQALPVQVGRIVAPPREAEHDLLNQLGRNLTALANQKKLHPAIGAYARKAMLQIALILQQTQANNPILLGDPGVGKTTIVEGFAYRLATDRSIVRELARKRIIDLSPAALLASTSFRGDLEARVRQLVAEVQASGGETIIFIDEIHTLIGGKAEGGLRVADMLKPALARGEFPCIGATTVAEYRRHIEADPALERRFTPVWIEEPTPEEAAEIVAEVVRSHLAPRHRVQYSDLAVREAVQLATRYIHDEFLPGKAIKLLDQAGPRVRMQGTLTDVRKADQLAGTGEVGVETIRAIVAERTGIPLTYLAEAEQQRLLKLEAILRRRVIGQEEALTHVAQTIRQARAGLANPQRPIGVLLFAGPPGIGKTELALALAETLFGRDNAILRLDMSEFMEKHQIARLIGAPPGYVGYQEEGQLTSSLRRRPYCVVLLDEFEKAHPEAQNLFLQLFDSGRLTDSRGGTVDGRNAIFVMTTNLGAREALGFAEIRKSYQEKLYEAIAARFSAEFLSRIDRIIYFEPLSEQMALGIFDKLFAQVVERFRAQNIVLQVDSAYKRAFCQHHSDRLRGARALGRAIEEEIVAPLAQQLLSGALQPGATITIGGDSPASPPTDA